MTDKNSIDFECLKCGGNKLVYQKYAKCLTPVSIPDNEHVKYGLSSFNEDDYLTVSTGFCCAGCNILIEHRGIRMETEKDLLDYLTMEPYLREHQKQEYDERLEAQIVAQDEQDAEQECYDMG